MTSAKIDQGASYTVGYGRPPQHTRFQKGHSGNPKGKIKGQKNFKTELQDELQSKVPVVEEGKRRLLSKQTIIVKRMVSDAAKGDGKARDQLLRLLADIERVQPTRAPDDPIGAAKDNELLAQFKLELIKNLQTNIHGGTDD